MIKGIESDVGNIDFELQAKRGDEVLFYIVEELQRIVHMSATRCPIEIQLRWSLDQNVAF